MEGVTPDGEIPEDARQQVMNELRQAFRPEFLNRVDETVLFSPLTTEELARIVELLLVELQQRLAERNITLETTPETVEHVARSAYDPHFGARPVKRYLQKHVETSLGRLIVEGKVPEGSHVRLSLEQGELHFDVEAREAVDEELESASSARVAS